MNKQPKSIAGSLSWSSLSVGGKVYTIIGICLAILCIVGGNGIGQLSRIGHEIEAIAERDIPMTGALTAVTVHQLEQAINFERSLRAGLTMALDPHAAEEYEKAKQRFEQLNAQIDGEIAGAIRLADSATRSAGDPGEQAMFQTKSDEIKKIAIGHMHYYNNVQKALALIDNGETQSALALIPSIEAEEEALDKEMERLLFEFEGYTEAAAQRAESYEKAGWNTTLVISAIGLLLGLTLPFLVVRFSITGPLRKVVAGLDGLANNNLNVEVAVHSEDEIGAVAAAFRRFKDALIKAKQFEAEQAAQKERAEDQQRLKMIDVADRFEASIGEVVSTVSGASSELLSTAGTMSALAEETNTQAGSVSTASEETTANMQSVAAGVEEMTRSISEIESRLSEASAKTTVAVTEAQESADRMSTLGKAVGEISKITAVISDIADQTNLLALNATIESARAGEAGKGFAVVASEVKELAGQTANATEQVIAQIQNIQASTDEAIEGISRVGDSIGELDETSAAISSAMVEQGAAAREISENIHQAANATAEVSRSVSGVSEASRETGAAANQVQSSADELVQQSDFLGEEVSHFIRGLREGPADRRKGTNANYDGEERREQDMSVRNAA